MQLKNVIRVALVTGGILLVPLVLQITIGSGIDGQGFNWKLDDFIVIGILLFIFGLMLDIVMRRLGKHKFIWAFVTITLFLWVYVELAVGLFTDWGS